MLSPVKAVVGALVFALGGLFLVAQPFDQPEVAVPGAEIWAQPPVAASVAQECVDIFATPVVCTWTASDPRLTGAMTHEWATPSITARLLDDDMGIGWADATVDGPDGSWTGHLYAVWADPAQLFAVLSGDRAYEGWQFVASTIADAEIVGSDQWTGVMYQGEPPPFGPPPAPTAD